MMKRILATILSLALLLGCAVAETAEEPVTTYQIEMKTFPFYVASRALKWRDDFPLYFIDGAEDLPFVEANDWKDLLMYIKGTDNGKRNSYDLTVEVDETGNVVTFTREDGTFTMEMDFDKGTISFLDFIAFNLNPGAPYMDFSGFPETDANGQPFLISRTGSRSRYGDYTVLNLKEYGIPMIAQDGKYLIPMQTLNAFNLSVNSIGVYFNGQAVFVNAIAAMENPWTTLTKTISQSGVLPEET